MKKSKILIMIGLITLLSGTDREFFRRWYKLSEEILKRI